MSFIFLTVFSIVVIGNNRPFSIYDTPEYTELPTCAQNPFMEGCDSLDCHTNNCFCRPDLMARAMDNVRKGASAACSGVAPAGVNSALAAIKTYCSRNGFTVATLSDKATGTSVLPSPTASPGAAAVLTNINLHWLLTTTHLRCLFQHRSGNSIGIFRGSLSK